MVVYRACTEMTGYYVFRCNRLFSEKVGYYLAAKTPGTTPWTKTAAASIIQNPPVSVSIETSLGWTTLFINKNMQFKLPKKKSWSLIWYVKSFIERLPKFIAWLLPRAAHHRNGSFCEAILSMQGFRIRAIHARTMTWRPPRIKTVTSRPCTETETNKQATRKFYNYTIVTLQLQKITHLELETKKANYSKMSHLCHKSKTCSYFCNCEPD